MEVLRKLPGSRPRDVSRRRHRPGAGRVAAGGGDRVARAFTVKPTGATDAIAATADGRVGTCCAVAPSPGRPYQTPRTVCPKYATAGHRLRARWPPGGHVACRDGGEPRPERYRFSRQFKRSGAPSPGSGSDDAYIKDHEGCRRLLAYYRYPVSGDSYVAAAAPQWARSRASTSSPSTLSTQLVVADLRHHHA